MTIVAESEPVVETSCNIIILYSAISLLAFFPKDNVIQTCFCTVDSFALILTFDFDTAFL